MARIVRDIEADVRGLASLDRDELAVLWTKAYGCPSPKGVRRELLVRSAAWQLQAKRLGGYSAETRRRLRSAIMEAGRRFAGRAATVGTPAPRGGTGIDVGPHHPDHPDTYTDTSVVPATASEPARRQRRKLQPGARLLRDWNGRIHVVDVIEGGYVFEARLYASLSAIAREITGTHWSGPRFFGL